MGVGVEEYGRNIEQSSFQVVTQKAVVDTHPNVGLGVEVTDDWPIVLSYLKSVQVRRLIGCRRDVGSVNDKRIRNNSMAREET